MPPQTIDFSKYEAPLPASTIDFSKYEQPKPQTQPSALNLLLPGTQEERETLLREVGSAWDTIKNTPKAIVQAVTAPPTQEEAQRYGGSDQVTGAKRVGLALERLTMQPAAVAADWYKDAAKGKIPDPIGQALTVAPEAMGNAAGSVVAAKLASMAPTAVRAIPRTAAKAITATGDLLQSPTLANAIQKGGHYLGTGLGYEAGQAMGHPFMGAGMGAAIGKAVSPVLAAQLARLGLKLSPQELGELENSYFPSARPDAMSQAVPPELDALSEAAARQQPPSAIRGLLPRGPIPAQPMASPEEPMAQPAARQIVRDPATGRMKVQFLTSTASPNQAVPVNTPQAALLRMQQAQAPAEAPLPAGYPEGMEPRPTDRAEIVDDKAAQDQMRHDLDKHGWNALSEERQQFYANNAPQMTKSQIIAHYQAEQIMKEATAKAQQVLETARVKAETPARFTKTTIPKTPAPATAGSQPGTQGLDVTQDLTGVLQRSLDAIKAKKGIGSDEIVPREIRWVTER